MNRRIVFSGSRTYTHRAWVSVVVERYATQAKLDGVTLVIVHGNCPSGSDAFVELAATRLLNQGYDIVLEHHDANWNDEGLGAGPRRNARMFLGATPVEKCVAFWDGVSRGTQSTIHEAIKAGVSIEIPVPPR